jgi:hypothetical protein
MKKHRPARPAGKSKIRNCVIISDQHFGCRFGLCPPGGARLDDGGRYTPSALQRVVWDWWREFWEEFVPQATNGEPYLVVNNGDVIDGCHHHSTTQISHNIADQKALAVAVLRDVVQRCEGRYYHVRGTEAHVGQSAVYEEEVAEQLGARPNQFGQHARWELWLNLCGHLIHFLHHIGTTGSSHHEASAVNAELAHEFTEAARYGERIPSVVVRSHRHRCIEVRLPIKGGWGSSIVTPAWQLKTPFVYRIPGARLAPPQIGGIVTRVHADTGEIFNRAWVRHIARAGVVEV